MRGKFTLFLLALMMMSCSKDWTRNDQNLDYSYGRKIPHGMIVLGDRLENPYTTENITKALYSLYPTKADRVDVKATNLYVRFLPSTDAEYETLARICRNLTDHPLDYDIAVEGDWYHDPSLPEGNLTWQYAVVAPDFDFPDVRYEVIDECYIAENDPGTRADGIDWEAVERQSYILTGNENRLSASTTKAAAKSQPSGRITIEDKDFNEGKPFGVAGVRVSCNSFVKFSHCYTDRDGYYQMDKSFASDLRYRLVFKNELGFSIGFNMVLVPASVSTLGKASPEGVDMTVTEESDDKLFRRCVVNNTVYDYISRCNADDLGILPPPADLRLWILNSMETGSAVMMHHGAVLQNDLMKSFLGNYARILEYFLPDITIGTKGQSTYKEIYSATAHELAHASHFAQVGTEYWDKYIRYVVESYVTNEGEFYGDGSAEGSGYCEVSEMWAYYLQSKLYKQRYGGTFPAVGTNWWFYPQIFRFMDERGLEQSDIFSVLTEDVDTRLALKNALLLRFPDDREMIDQVFSRY